MPFPLSPQSIAAIADIISGGGGHDTTPPIGIYRSGPKIEKFMRGCNVAFTVNGSRVPSLVERLINLNNGYEAAQVLPRIIEAAADPRDFTHDAERHVAVLDHLNRALRFDGFELQQQGGRMRLVEAGKNVPVLAELAGLSEVIDFDTVSRDLDRALAKPNRPRGCRHRRVQHGRERVPVDPHRTGAAAPCQERRAGALQCREAAAWSVS